MSTGPLISRNAVISSMTRTTGLLLNAPLHVSHRTVSQNSLSGFIFWLFYPQSTVISFERMCHSSRAFASFETETGKVKIRVLKICWKLSA